MRFVERVGRLVRSDAHGILDHLEERSLLLKQHLRDAEIEVHRKRSEALALEDEQRRLREQAERLEAKAKALDEDVELALAGDKLELARFAIARLLPIREAHRGLAERIAEVAASRDRLAERLDAQESELEALSARVRARLSELQREETTAPPLERPVADEEIELELLRRGRAPSGGAR
jgi:phage shock protein A